jgi:hypothetical protein
MKKMVPVPGVAGRCREGGGVPFVGEAAVPDGCVGAQEELFEGALLSGDQWGGGKCGYVVRVAQEGGGLGEASCGESVR